MGRAPGAESVSGAFAELLAHIHAQTGQRVVVLVDEYDKPILDNLTEPEIAKAMRDGLRDLYSVLKGQDGHIKFAMRTGVSKFSKVSLFSGLNILVDVTVDANYSALCGDTEEDVDTVFAPELPGFDREEIRRRYNGHHWTGTSVYNPFDVPLLFRNREFKPYWFETGTPTFLMDVLTQRHTFTPDLQRRNTSLELLPAFDVDRLTPEALLFQTGYATIQHVEEYLPGQRFYQLGYLNLEVSTSLNSVLLQGLGLDGGVSLNHRLSRLKLLRARDWPGLQALFTALFASIPHDWYRNHPIARYEGYHASIFSSHFAALGLDIRLEDVTNQGRIDMTVLFDGQVLLFEFKVVELSPEGAALQQLKDRAYADKCRSRGEPIHLIGVEFSKAQRRVVGIGVETLGA